MKTAVSLPDDLFHAAEQTAEYLGIPRSQLFARALEEFIRNHGQSGITGRLDEVYGKLGSAAAEAENPAALEALRKLTADDAW